MKAFNNISIALAMLLPLVAIGPRPGLADSESTVKPRRYYKPEVFGAKFVKACPSDLKRFCGTMPEIQALQELCLMEHITELSESCRDVWTSGMTPDQKAFMECLPNPDDHHFSLWAPAEASNVQYRRCDVSDVMSYHLEILYPAASLIKQILETATGDAWGRQRNNPTIRWVTIRDRKGKACRAIVINFVNREQQQLMYTLYYSDVQDDEVPTHLNVMAVVSPIRPPYQEAPSSSTASPAQNMSSSVVPFQESPAASVAGARA